MRRMETADEAARPVLFPMSGENGYITGAEVAIDGGATPRRHRNAAPPAVDRAMRAVFRRSRDLSARSGVPKLAGYPVGAVAFPTIAQWDGPMGLPGGMARWVAH